MSLRSPVKSLSPQKQRSLAVQSIKENYELETSTRRAAMEAAITDLLARLKFACESELRKIPQQIEHMSVGEFMDVFRGNVKAAMASVIHRQAEQEQARLQADRPIMPPASIKKRKRNADASPSIPPSPLPQAKRHAGIAHAVPLVSASRNFTYDPSLPSTSAIPTTPRLPQRTADTSTRQPRQNEPVQAYSMNGSPLGVIAQEAWNAVPSGEFTFRMTLDSLTKGLEDELSKGKLDQVEKQQLQSRLLKLVQDLGGGSTSATS